MLKKSINLDEYHNLTKNSIWVLVSNMSMVFILIITIVASRILGDELFGKYTFLAATSALLSDLSVLGTTIYLSVLVARIPDDTGILVANAIGLRIPLAILFVVVCLIIVVIRMPEVLAAGLMIALDWVLRAYIHLFRAVFRARNLFNLDARVATIERFSVAICTVLAIIINKSLLSFAIGFFVGRTVGLGACLYSYVKMNQRIWIEWNYTIWKKLISGGFPIGIRSVFKGVSFRIDAIMLGILRPAYELGWYGAAYKFLEAGFFLVEAVGGAIQPAISREYGKSNKHVVADIYGRGYKVLFVCGAIIAGFGFTYANHIVAIVYGSEYLRAAEAFKFLIWAMLFVFGSMTSITLLDAVDSAKKSLVPFVIAAIFNVSLNLVLIPKIGFVGAALSTLATEFYLMFHLLIMTNNLGYKFPKMWNIGPLLAGLAAMILSSFIFRISYLGISLGLIGFFVVIFETKVFDEVDAEYAKHIIYRTKTSIKKINPLNTKAKP